MNIEHKDINNFDCDELERQFLSVEWSSGHFPDKLVVAMQNFNTVYSTWDGNKLVGMVCAFVKSKDASPMYITSLWT